jgi:uncharacterized membrane protein
MTQDEIIDMAIQAELNLYVHDLTEKQYIQVIETFAKLVAAKEREECAKVCDELQDVPATEPRHCAEDIRARG